MVEKNSAKQKKRFSRERSTMRRSVHGTSGSKSFSNKSEDPLIPPEIHPSQLNAEIRQELTTLGKGLADKVACHLIAAGQFLDTDPTQALRHAQAARNYSQRIPAIREAVGIAAYRCGDWGQALSELRAARRMGTRSILLPILADCERGMGRPQRAIELATSPEANTLHGDDADELRIVLAGARAELGHFEQALTVLTASSDNPSRSQSMAARLSYARAEILLALGKHDEALKWFFHSASIDIDEITDAEERIAELTNQQSLLDQHDCLLLDLDGTVFRGAQPTVGALDALAKVTIPIFFVTNNASRGPEDVAQHLRDLGFQACAANVVTSAQTGVNILAQKLPPGSHVFVLGTSALHQLVQESGLTVVDSYDQHPLAVIQGHSPQTDWAHLAEAALIIREGGLWVVTNMDSTLPSERGLLPGNGSIAAALYSTTGITPLVVGKPDPTLFREALSRGSFHAPLVVGDRLDTDIAGAHAAGLPSLMVFTGVNGPHDLLEAPPEHRPTYIGQNLEALYHMARSLGIGPQPNWKIVRHDNTFLVSSTHYPLSETDDGLSLLRALAHARWETPVSHPHYKSEDDQAKTMLTNYGLLTAESV